MAGIEYSGGLPLDGVNVLPVLQGESRLVNPKRFWQWNRYAPEVTCNAAMRDGHWKLVRPKIPEAMKTVQEEMTIDIQLGNDPESFDRSWLTAPMPDRELPEPELPELYNLEEDPGETNNLAADESGRLHRMMVELENWFESVEKAGLIRYESGTFYFVHECHVFFIWCFSFCG
jgi:hypothetical protein